MKTSLLLGLTLIAFSALRAETDTAALEQKIEQAYYRGDAALLTEAQTELTAAQAAQPNAPALAYLQGFVELAQANSGYATGDKKAVEAGLVKADATLKKVKGAPWDAEALALRGLITGQLIGLRGASSGVTLGPKMMNYTSEAFERAPQSPRVMVFHGVTLLNMPAMFGGDADEAVRLFARAAATFESKAKTPNGPQWGHAEALCWLAQAKLKKGDFAGAKAAAEQALVVEPAYGRVSHGLLPAIERKIASK